MNMEGKFTKKLDFQVFTGIIGLGLILILFKSFIVNEPKKTKLLSNFDSTIVVVSGMNKGCPMMLDRETRLDNIFPSPPNTIQFNYTLVNWVKESLDIDALIKRIEPGLINGVKTSPDLKLFRDERVILMYNLRDKNGVFLYKIVVTPEMYSD